jgi:hypothetical protein
MALSEFYESTIVEVNASFGFGDFPCAPEVITEALGLAPDDARTKGDRRTSAFGGRVIVVPFSTWSIQSVSRSKDINEHLRELLARLGTAKRPFDPSWGEPSFGVSWHGNYLYAGSGPFYERDVLAGIAAVGASLHQDIYQVDEDDEAADGDTRLRRIPKKFFLS